MVISDKVYSGSKLNLRATQLPISKFYYRNRERQLNSLQLRYNFVGLLKSYSRKTKVYHQVSLKSFIRPRNEFLVQNLFFFSNFPIKGLSQTFCRIKHLRNLGL